MWFFYFLTHIYFTGDLMMVMNCFLFFFCGTVGRWKAFSFISSPDHCQGSSSSRISDTPWAWFEPAQSQSSGFAEWSCAAVITTTPRRHTSWGYYTTAPLHHGGTTPRRHYTTALLHLGFINQNKFLCCWCGYWKCEGCLRKSAYCMCLISRNVWVQNADWMSVFSSVSYPDFQ